MKYVTLSYGRTFNMGKFESERIDMQVSIDELEQGQILTIQKHLKDIVEEMHSN
jgi:hypothetical protein